MLGGEWGRGWVRGELKTKMTGGGEITKMS